MQIPTKHLVIIITVVPILLWLLTCYIVEFKKTEFICKEVFFYIVFKIYIFKHFFFSRKKNITIGAQDGSVQLLFSIADMKLAETNRRPI